jgi:hypothetical protein
VANFTDEFIAEMNIPELPESIPERLEQALRARIDALLYQLRQAKAEQYVRALEVRLVREAYHAVLAGYELDIADCEVLYATFRHLVEDLGYAAAEVGFSKRRPPGGPDTLIS